MLDPAELPVDAGRRTLAAPANRRNKCLYGVFPALDNV